MLSDARADCQRERPRQKMRLTINDGQPRWFMLLVACERQGFATFEATGHAQVLFAMF